MTVLFQFDRALYSGTRLLIRLILGRRRRDSLFKKHGITLNKFLFGNPVVEVNGVRAHVRRNTNDYDILRENAEDIIRPHLALNNGETFVDVGANIGRYTIEVASMHKSTPIQIISIEAHPETFRALQRNVRECNKLSNTSLVQKAVSGKKGRAEFYEVEGLSDFNSMYRKYGRKLVLESDTLDNILEEAGVRRADLVKIDVEGAELDVLKGAPKTLQNARKVIVEVHQTDLNDYGGFGKIQEALEGHGLRVSKLQSAFVFAVGERD
ncbi:MAG: FkbM family methyltransferase [Nitrososphaera sp.]|nr:FkbM family methyltransferase [Nitrososphaera sp.]